MSPVFNAGNQGILLVSAIVKTRERTNGTLGCNTCHNSSHSDNDAKGKNMTDKVNRASGTSGDNEEEMEHLFVFETNAMQVKGLLGSQMLY